MRVLLLLWVAWMRICLELRTIAHLEMARLILGAILLEL